MNGGTVPRQLTEPEVSFLTSIREMEGNNAQMMDAIEQAVPHSGDPAAGRWASLARTHLETGFMYAVKAITRPLGGLGRRNPQWPLTAGPAQQDRPSSTPANDGGPEPVPEGAAPSGGPEPT